MEVDGKERVKATDYSAKAGYTVQAITAGGSTDYNTALKAEFNSGKEPDIFVIEGPSGYELYKEKIATMNDAEWLQYTAAAYLDPDGNVVGFPVAEIARRLRDFPV